MPKRKRAAGVQKSSPRTLQTQSRIALRAEIRKLRHEVARRAQPATPDPVAAVSDSEYQQLYDVAAIPWVLIDDCGIVRDINSATCAVLGVRHRLVTGSPMRMWVAAEFRPALLEHLRQVRLINDVVESELGLKLPHGTLPVGLCSRRVLFKGATVFPTIAIDTSQQMQLDQALKAAERQRDLAERERRAARAAEAAKDRLIAMVSHELRNPLSPALIAAATLSEWPALPERVRQMADVIKRNIELEARLIDDLLDVARITRGKLDLRIATIDVHSVIAQAIDTCSAAAAVRQVTIGVQLNATAHHVRGDAARLEQVFWNLLNNAIKFSHAGGEVTVRSRTDISGVISMSVRDQGIGMDEATIERLFSPFDRPPTAPGPRSGLGLGLTIARGIVEAHGGHFWASSAGPDQGATFEIDLVAVAPDETSAAIPETLREPALESRRGGRVLIIEDHEDTGALLEGFLEHHGYAVTWVQSVAEATTALARPWDVVLSDIGLGDGTGLEIARRARSGLNRPSLLVALSGYGAENDVLASHQAGFDRHLVKPVDLTQLLQLLETADARA